MFGPPKNKNGEPHRYYLLPGMGKANRRKHQQILWASIVVGLIISAVIGTALYFLNKAGPGGFGGVR
jgi:hypothetical protein